MDFMIIGAPKAGTTSLCDYLAQHPDLFLPALKENHFFARDEFYRQGEKYLDAFYGDLGAEELVGGAHVHLMLLSYTAERIRGYNPSMKTIAVLRNPIDRAYSAYWFSRMRGTESSKTFEMALEREQVRQNGSYQERVELAYLQSGMYCDQLTVYMKTFGHDNVFVVLTENLRDHAGQIVKDILVWLGADPGRGLIDTNKQSNLSGKARFPWVQKQLCRTAWYKRFYRRITSPGIRRTVRERVIEPVIMRNIRRFRYPPMRPETRARLAEYYAPHNRKLSDLLGRDLSHWR